MGLKKIIRAAAAVLLCVCITAGCAAVPEKEAPPVSEMPTQTQAPTPTPAPTPAPTPTKPPFERLQEGAQGEEVLRLQERLIALEYIADGAATDYYGSTTASAVKAFQKQNGLQDDGIAGEDTQELLFSEEAKKCDPFSKFAPTVNMSFEELMMSDDGTRDEYPQGYPKADTYKIIVDIEHQVTMIYEKDEDGEYTVPVRYMLCSTGKNDCTPKGKFKMDSYRVRFSQFVRDKTYGQYWTQIRGAIYFHTILYSEFDTNTYIEEVWDKIGTADSHGCVRLSVPDAKWMWFNIAPGTTCVIRDGDSDDEQTAAVRERLVLAKLPEERVEMNPRDIPSTDNWRVEDVPHDVPFVQGSQN